MNVRHDSERFLKWAAAVAAVTLAAGIGCGKSKQWDDKADKEQEVTRQQLREQRGAEVKAKVDKVVAVLNAAMRVPRTRDGKAFVAIQNAIRVKDIVAGH